MTSKTRTLLGYLICALGFTILLLITTKPHVSVNGKTSHYATIQLPSIRFSEKTIRLEAVYSGETSSGSIFASNIGNKVISNVTVKAGCNCGNVKLSDTVINPGKSIRIDFSVNTSGKYEDFIDRFLFSYSEEGQNLFDMFYVAVPILAPGKIVAEPSSIQFYEAKVGDSFSKNIELRVKDLPQNESVDIVDIRLPDWLSSEIEKKDDYWRLTLTGSFPNQSGRYVELVQIKSSSQQYPEMTIPIIVEYAAIPNNDVISLVESGKQ